MEKKEERPSQKNIDAESHDHLSNEDQQKMHVDYANNNPRNISSSQDIVSSATQQQLPTLQWPYTPQGQTTLEHPHSGFTFSIQQSIPVNGNQRQLSFLNSQQQQQNPVNNETQIGQSQGPPAAGPFWLPPRPGFHATSIVCQPLAPMVTSDSNWQAPVVVGGTSSGPETVSTYCYQSGQSYPMGFPGPWYPTALWGQQQQSHPPYSLHYPACAGGYGYFGAPPRVPDSSLSVQLEQKGIIPLAAKLSQKHQQMWEAQSAENVYLRTALCRMEAEMAAYRSRLIWLEAEVSSLKAQRDSVVEGAGPALAVQTSKRGRPKRTITSTSGLPFSDDLQPRTRGRKPISSCKVETDTKVLSSNRESNQEENGVKPSHTMLGIGTISIPMKEDVKVSSGYTDGVSEIHGSKLNIPTDIPTPPTFHNHPHKNPGIQISEVGPNPVMELKGCTGREKNRKTAFSTPHQSAKETHVKGPFALDPQMWHSNIISDDCRRNTLDIRSHAFFDDANIIRHEGKAFSGWSFVNEDASEEHEDMAGSGKDEEEMEEAASSAADDMSQPKPEDDFGINPSTVISKGLRQMSRW